MDSEELASARVPELVGIDHLLHALRRNLTRDHQPEEYESIILSDIQSIGGVLAEGLEVTAASTGIKLPRVVEYLLDHSVAFGRQLPYEKWLITLDSKSAS